MVAAGHNHQLRNLAAVLIPEFTKVFTSSHSKHVHEIVTASREGGASLTILSGLVAGNFSAFWNGILIAALMGAAFFVSGLPGGINEVMAVQLERQVPHPGRRKNSRTQLKRTPEKETDQKGAESQT